MQGPKSAGEYMIHHTCMSCWSDAHLRLFIWHWCRDQQPLILTKSKKA